MFDGYDYTGTMYDGRLSTAGLRGFSQLVSRSSGPGGGEAPRVLVASWFDLSAGGYGTAGGVWPPLHSYGETAMMMI